jgi:YesN/AraC family two-component response regulator
MMRTYLNFPMTRVLIADDSEPVRSGLHELIEDHAGWVCTEAVNGHDAVTKIQQRAPDILVLDLFMPVMSSLFSAPRPLRLA